MARIAMILGSTREGRFSELPAAWISDRLAAQLFTGEFKVQKYVVIRADSGNSGTISLGNTATRASSGFILKAGDTSPKIKIDDLSKVWLVGSASSQAYSWISV